MQTAAAAAEVASDRRFADSLVGGRLAACQTPTDLVTPVATVAGLVPGDYFDGRAADRSSTDGESLEGAEGLGAVGGG